MPSVCSGRAAVASQHRCARVLSSRASPARPVDTYSPTNGVFSAATGSPRRTYEVAHARAGPDCRDRTCGRRNDGTTPMTAVHRMPAEIRRLTRRCAKRSGRAEPGERRLRPRDVGDGRQSRRRRVRGGVHGRQPRRSVARQPRHLRAEGQHRERIQPAGPRAVDREPLHRGAARRQPVRSAGEQPGRHGRRVSAATPSNYGRPNDPMVGGRSAA